MRNVRTKSDIYVNVRTKSDIYVFILFIANTKITLRKKQFVNDLQQVDGSSGFLHQSNWSPRYNWNIVESGIKHHNTRKRNE